MARTTAARAAKAPAKETAKLAQSAKTTKPSTTPRKNGVTNTTSTSRSTTKKSSEQVTKAPPVSQKSANTTKQSAATATVSGGTSKKATKASAASKKTAKKPTTKAKAHEKTTRKNGVTKPASKSRSTTNKAADKVTKAVEAANSKAKATASKASTTSKKSTKAPTTKTKGPAINAKVPEKTSNKRSHDDEDDEEEAEASAPPPAKKARIVNQPAAKPKINKAPTQRLDVFVNGENSAGELGLGSARTAIDVKRPRLNPLLKANEVGVVQIACGGMHVAALTHDNKILTWGINDQGQLGRDTEWSGGMKDIADDGKSDSEDSDSGLNPLESTPIAVPASNFPDGTVFVKVSAGDGHTLALTDEGLVYGWGQYRKTDGVLGFTAGSKAEKESKPVLLPGLTKIVHITSGANHAMAMDNKGTVYIWGNGEQNQLGYHVIQRTGSEGPKLCLKPQPLRTKIRKYLAIYTGSDHSFAVDQQQRVWAWGVNNNGACGIVEGAGDDNAAVFTASHVTSLDLENDSIAHISGGQNHSIAVTSNGKALVWGNNTGARLGLDINTVAESSIIRDEHNNPRIVVVPTEIPNVGKTTWVSAGADHNYLINDQGHAYSWGIGSTNQLGLGAADDTDLPTQIENTAVRGRKLEWSGCGGQYSMLAAAARDESIN
ncbi:regulator of chromosome condensation, partial [Lecanoromycetidae sp. Uapishka_2]